MFFSMYQDMNKSYREGSSLFCRQQPIPNEKYGSPKKNIFCQKTRHFLNFRFSPNHIFRLGILTNFEKNIKKWRFFGLTTAASLFQSFFSFFCVFSSRERNAVFWAKAFLQGKNDPFFNFCIFLKIPPRRHCNLTRENDIILY